jgi:hypothetical protein
MKDQQSRVVSEFGKFAQAFWVELPMEATKRLLSNDGNEDGVRKAGWKAYDAFVSLANETANMLYSNPLLGTLTGRTIEQTLRVQHMGRAATSGMLANMWSTLGLPTVDEISSLRTELKALHDEMSHAIGGDGPSRQTGSVGVQRTRFNGYPRPQRRTEDDENAAA